MKKNINDVAVSALANLDRVGLAIVDSLKSGKSLFLDDAKGLWGSREVNKAVRDLSRAGIAGVHRRKIHFADGDAYRFIEGRVEQRGPGRFVLVFDNKSEAFLTPKSSKSILNGDKLSAFAAFEPDGDTEAIPVSVISRDPNREHIVRAKTSTDGSIGFFLDGRNEDVKVSADSVPVVGDIWTCRIAERGLLRDESPGVLARRIGNELDSGIESKLAFESRFPNSAECHDADWPEKFSLMDASDVGARTDLRDISFATIDGQSSSDFDDAVFAEKIEKGYRIIVAIADVSSFVQLDSKLDQFALEKMTSVYLPHIVHPMLPRVLSTGICSLNPNEDRLALCCDMVVADGGSIENYSFYRATIKSHERLTYESAQKFLDGDSRLASPKVEASMMHLSAAAEKLRSHGMVGGRLDMGEDEISFVLGADGKIQAVKSSPRLWTHKLVEECMLAANKSAAEFVESAFGHGIYRNHAGVKAESLAGVHEALAAMGLTVGDGISAISQGQITEALADAKAIGKYSQARSAVLGGMSSANYSEGNKGHFSLVASHYCHFTSPIRRYADLMVHRMIKAALDGVPSPYVGGLGVEMAQKASVCSQKASQAEAEARKLLVLNFAAKSIGSGFDSNVSTIGERGVWVGLPLGGAHLEFFIPARTLKNSGFAWSDDGQSWEVKGVSLVEGGVLPCTLRSVDMVSRRLDLEPRVPAPASEPNRGPRPV